MKKICLIFVLIFAIPFVYSYDALIEHDINGYKFIKSDIADEQAEQLIESLKTDNASSFFAYYSKDNMEITLLVASFKSASDAKAYVKDYSAVANITYLDNNYLFFFEGDFIVMWHSGNYFIMVDETPLPKDIIMEYLKKYPSDISLSHGKPVDWEEIEQLEKKQSEGLNEAMEERHAEVSGITEETNEKIRYYSELKKECENNRTLVQNNSSLLDTQKIEMLNREKFNCSIYDGLIEDAKQEYYEKIGYSPLTEEQLEKIRRDPKGEEGADNPEFLKKREEEIKAKLKYRNSIKNFFAGIGSFLSGLFKQ